FFLSARIERMAAGEQIRPADPTDYRSLKLSFIPLAISGNGVFRAQSGKRRNGPTGQGFRLVANRNWSDRELAPKPGGGGGDMPQLAVPDVRLVGFGAHQYLQRQLCPDTRQASSFGARTTGAGGLGRDLGSDRSAGRRGDAARRGNLERARAAHDGTQGLYRGDLLHLVVQPHLRRVRRHRRRVLRLLRRDAAGADRARARPSAAGERYRTPAARTGVRAIAIVSRHSSWPETRVRIRQ